MTRRDGLWHTFRVFNSGEGEDLDCAEVFTKYDAENAAEEFVELCQRRGHFTVDTEWDPRFVFVEEQAPVEAFELDNGNRMVFDKNGNQIFRLQKKPWPELPPEVPVTKIEWDAFRGMMRARYEKEEVAK